MQGQRSTIDSFTDSFQFDHGSSSSNAVADEQLWNGMLNPVEPRLPAYILSPNETNITTYGNAASQDGHSTSGWNSVEPQSTENTRNCVIDDEMKMGDEWSSLVTRAETGSRFEDTRYEPVGMLSLESDNINLNGSHVSNGPSFLRNSNSDDIPQNINLNAGYEDNSSNVGQFMEASVCPHPLDTEQVSLAHGPTFPFGTASGSGGYIVEESDNRPGCSLDGRRLSCKRKALEGASGQSSLCGIPGFQHAESSAWHAVPARYNAASSSTASTRIENPSVINPPEQLNPEFGVGTGVASDGHPVLSVAGNGESSRRNFRTRINSAQRLGPVQPNLLLAGSGSRRSQVPSSHQQSRLLPFYHSLDPRPTGNANSMHNQSLPIPGIVQTVHPFLSNGASSSRVGSLPNSPAISGDRGVALREEAVSRSISRNISEHPLFVHASEMRNLARDPPNRSSANGNASIPGNVASSSRIGSSSGIHPPAPAWLSHHNPSSQYPQRLSEFSRRSLFQSAGSDSGGQSSNFPPLPPNTFVSSQEIALPAGADNQGHYQPYPTRSTLRMNRQSDGVLGVPLRSLAAASEGRSRLVSEIRNVLDLMRRGENLRFEDFLILDQSVFYGVTEMQDRHRDMRLDVDNMSYEELLALEERIGNVSTGLTEETIMKRLKKRKYSSMSIGTPSEIEPCCICQEEYNDGEDLGTLDCGHDFHTACIKQWLILKNLCPICKTTALVP